MHPHDIQADERPAAAAAGQGQHRARRRAQARGDRHRRPCRRPSALEPAPLVARVVFEGHHRWAARRAALSPAGNLDDPGHTEEDRAETQRSVGNPWCQQPTTCKMSTSTSRSLCWSLSPASRGSGKSSLIHGSVARRDGSGGYRPDADSGARDGAIPRRTPDCSSRYARRSQKENGVKPALFSANSEGACPNCNGAGVIYTDPGDDGRRGHSVVTCAREKRVRGIGGSSTSLAAATSVRCSRWPVTEAPGVLRRRLHESSCRT